ncbi:MAG: hypothetical protein AVDCRST_MAG59-4657, partial [uncultured Thermomicrobiales bacterium]
GHPPPRRRPLGGRRAAAPAAPPPAERRAAVRRRPRRAVRHPLRAVDRRPLVGGAPRPGRGQPRHLLAAVAGLAAGRGVGRRPPRAAGRTRGRRPDRLGAGLPRQRERPGQKGGDGAGPNPTDRGKPGCKLHVL